MSTDYEKYKKVMKQKENVSCKDFESLLLSEGFKFRSQAGTSHRIFKNDKTGIMISFPQGKLMAIGTLRKELKKVYPAWNVKPVDSPAQDIAEVKPEFELNESMLALAFELNLDVENITEEDYNTLAELIEA